MNNKDSNKEPRSLYVCTTPFQIMSSIILTKERKEIADICIDSTFSGANELTERIVNAKIFECIFDVSNSKKMQRTRSSTGYKKKVLTAIELIVGKGIYKDLLKGYRYYDYIFTTGNNQITRYILNYIFKRKWLTEVVFYDDGEGSYDDDVIFGLGRKKRTLINRLITKELPKTQYTRYLYSPELYRLTHGESNDVIKRMPRGNEFDKTVELIRQIYKVDEIDTIDEHFILLDVIASEVFQHSESEYYRYLVSKIISIVGVSNICIKQHPRDKNMYPHEVRTYNNRGVPFECLSLKINTNNSVLITLTSTAAFMPKLLWGKEYCVILLYKLFNLSLGDDSLREDLYEGLKSEYEDPCKVIIPETEEELFKCLQWILKEN